MDENNICRICLKENNEEFHCIFNAHDCTGSSLQFAEMLMSFTTVQIILGDGLPEQICSNCIQDTIKMYLFKIKCEESDKSLRNRLEKCSLMIIDKIEIDEEDIFDKIIKTEIKDEYVTESGLSDSGDVYCVQQSENCPETIVGEENKYSQFHVDTTENSLSTNPENNLLLCDNKISKIAHKIKITEQKHDFEEYKINEDEKSENNDEFDHSRKNRYQCDVCKKKFSTSTALISHKSKHAYECDVCEKKFSSPWALTKHKRIHSGEKPFACDICEKKFRQSGALLTHKRIHTGEKPYECDVCKKKFTVSSSLINHKRIHTGEKPYECDICKKKFIESGLLIRHKRTHTGEKPYECDVCEKKFSVPWALITHKRTHTDGYECNVCLKTFSASGTLINHKRKHHTHTEENE